MVRIFIVEDDPAIRRFYKLALEGIGFVIIGIARDGQECVEMYKSFSEKPDVIIMDHRMPIKDGIEAATEILQVDSNVKIIFATADGEVQDLAKSIGVSEILKKPFDLEQLINGVKKISNY